MENSGEIQQKVTFGERLRRVPHNVWGAIAAGVVVVAGLIVFIIFITMPRSFTPDTGAKIVDCGFRDVYRITYAATTKISDGYFHIAVNAYLPRAEQPTVLVDGEEVEVISDTAVAAQEGDMSYVPSGCKIGEEKFTVFNVALVAKAELTCREERITLKGEGYEVLKEIDRQFCKTPEQVDAQKGVEDDAASSAADAEEAAALARNPWRNLTPNIEKIEIDKDGRHGTLTVKSWPAVKGNGSKYPHPDMPVGGRDFVATNLTSGYMPVLITITNVTDLQWKVYAKARIYSKEEGKTSSKVEGVFHWCGAGYIDDRSFCSWSDPVGKGESVIMYGYVVVRDFTEEGFTAASINGQVIAEAFLYNGEAGGEMTLNFEEVGGKIVLGL
jgi:hypothetical protein